MGKKAPGRIACECPDRPLQPGFHRTPPPRALPAVRKAPVSQKILRVDRYDAPCPKLSSCRPLECIHHWGHGCGRVDFVQTFSRKRQQPLACSRRVRHNPDACSTPAKRSCQADGQPARENCPRLRPPCRPPGWAGRPPGVPLRRDDLKAPRVACRFAHTPDSRRGDKRWLVATMGARSIGVVS